MDPTDTQRGPFDSKQMHMWYANGYFKTDLRLRSTSMNTFTTLGKIRSLCFFIRSCLGELVQCFGGSPFQPKVSTTPPSHQEDQKMPMSSGLTPNIWGPPTKPLSDPIADKVRISIEIIQG